MDTFESAFWISLNTFSSGKNLKAATTVGMHIIYNYIYICIYLLS